jgi:hypothetical protein
MDAELVEANGLGVERAIIRQVGKGTASPERQGPAEHLGGAPVPAPFQGSKAVPGKGLEPLRINPIRIEGDPVAPLGPTLDRHVIAERSAEPGDVRPKGDPGALGRLAGPQLIDQTIGADRRPWMHGQQGQERPDPRPADRDLATVANGLNGTKEPDLQVRAVDRDRQSLLRGFARVVGPSSKRIEGGSVGDLVEGCGGAFSPGRARRSSR